MSPLRVGVVFGGRSVEHEVSVISAHQVMAALDPSVHTVVPVYIAKSGRWYTGDVLMHLAEYGDPDDLAARARPVQLSTDPERPGLLDLEARRAGVFGGRGRVAAIEPLDLIFPVIHGSHGEDGSLQGVCEIADIAYCGPDVTAAAVCMDKALTKVVLRGAGLPVVDDLTVSRTTWRASNSDVAAEVRDRFGYPVFVKPMSLGSSIGVSRVASDDELVTAMDVAFSYQDRVIVEPAQDGIIEVNCSVLGDARSARASMCEQPVTAGVLSYEDKYMSHGAKGAKGGRGGKPGAAVPAKLGGGGDAARGGVKGSSSQGMSSAQRIIPAPIGDALTDAIQRASIRACAALGVSGVARVDFLVRPERGEFLVNEVNPIPGSLSFYLWEPAGVSFAQLCARVIDLALHRHAIKRGSTYSIDSWLLRP